MQFPARIVGPFLCCIASLAAADELNLPDSAADIAPDEPRAKVFSLERAARYLDRAALDWQHTHGCASCHTMLPYMMCRPVVGHLWPQSGEVRQFFDEVASGTRDAMPNYACADVDGAVAVGVAGALAINDRMTSGKLQPTTRQALDRMWTLQRPDGGWQWPFRDTPPLKTREHYGVTLAAIATGMAPDDYQSASRARQGLASIRRFLAQMPPVSLHESAMLLWASTCVDGLLNADGRAEVLAKLMSVQRPDGGWSMAHLVDNTNDPMLTESKPAAQVRAEQGYGSKFLAYIGPGKAYRSVLESDGYATGFVIFLARRAGLAANDTRLLRGIAWLKHNQRASGRWFTPSQSWHTQHLISNAGTGYALLALAACGETDPK